MNQDFGLSLTSANARRLLRFQKIFKLELSPELETLAEQNRIDETLFDPFVCPYSEIKATITQFLLDCNLRGIVQQNYHPEFGEIELLNVIKIKNPPHITICTDRKDFWQNSAKHLLMRHNIHFQRYFGISGEDIDKLRDGVLIIDLGMQTDYSYVSKIRDLGNEFPSTLFFSPKIEKSDMLVAWTNLARALFPTMPHPLYPRLVKNIPDEWKEISLCLFATFYNMCLFPEYVTDPTIITLMSDDNHSLHNIGVI